MDCVFEGPLNVARKRPWQHMTIIDLVLGTSFPSAVFFTTIGWPLLLTFEPNIPIQLINIRLLAPLKEYWILVILFGAIDVHVVLFTALHFGVLVFLLILSCEKFKTKGRTARDCLG